MQEGCPCTGQPRLRKRFAAIVLLKACSCVCALLRVCYCKRIAAIVSPEMSRRLRDHASVLLCRIAFARGRRSS